MREVLRERPVAVHAAWVSLWALLTAVLIVVREPGTRPGTALAFWVGFVGLLVGSHGVGRWVDRRRPGSGFRLRAFAWAAPVLAVALILSGV